MSENPRDTQFMGFAKGVWGEITTTLEALEVEHEIVDGCLMCNWTPEKIAQVVEPLIARRAYDLVLHAVNETIGTGDVSSVPDLTELPKGQG